MKATPTRLPAANPSQYQRGSETPLTASTPVTTMTLNATMPINGFGKPNSDACEVTITDPHDRTGLRLHDGLYVGSVSMLIFSTVRASEAASPSTPAMSTHHALAGRTATPAGGAS